MNADVAHDGEGDRDAGEKEQGRSADQERHAQEDRRPEEDGCSAGACGTEEDRGNEGSGSEEDSRQKSHNPEEGSGSEEDSRQKSHNPEEGSGSEEDSRQKSHNPEEGSGSEEDSRQKSHNPEEGSGSEEDSRQKSHNPEEDGGPEEAGNQDVRAAGGPSPSSSGAHGDHDANGEAELDSGGTNASTGASHRRGWRRLRSGVSPRTSPSTRGTREGS